MKAWKPNQFNAELEDLNMNGTGLCPCCMNGFQPGELCEWTHIMDADYVQETSPGHGRVPLNEEAFLASFVIHSACGVLMTADFDLANRVAQFIMAETKRHTN